MKYFQSPLLILLFFSSTIFAQKNLQKATPIKRSSKKIKNQFVLIKNPIQTDDSNNKTKPITEEDLQNYLEMYSSNIRPYCYAHLNTDGSVEMNPTTRKIQTARLSKGSYLIYLGSSDDADEYIVSTTMTADPGFINIKKEAGEFMVYTYNMSGHLSDKAFDFIVYSMLIHNNN